MTPNNNLNILPFYSTLKEQNHYKPYAYGQVYTLISPNFKLLPFQIVRPHTTNALTIGSLYKLGNAIGTNLLSIFVNAGLHVTQFTTEGYDLIINDSILAFEESFLIDPGQYYIKLQDGVNTWYSEIFTVVKDLTPYMKLEYSDPYRISYAGGHIDYTAPYKNYLYIQTEIGTPEYPFEELGQDRDGHFFVEKQISEKKYMFKLLAPEYLCDALRIVRMHSFITIFFRGKQYSVESIIFDPKWQEQGYLATVEVEFQCDTVVKKIGRGLTYSDNGGDFNYDYSDDFN